MSMTLLLASMGVSLAAAVLSLLLVKADDAAKNVGCLLGAVAAALSCAAGVLGVLGRPATLDTWFLFPFANLELLLNGL